MRSDVLRAGQEVLEEPGYQRLARVACGVRLAAWVVTALLSGPASPVGWVVLGACIVLSAWSVVDPTFIVRYVRHPLIVLGDTTLVVMAVVTDPRQSLSVFALAVTSLLVGLLLVGWLALPALMLLLASVFQLGLESQLVTADSSAFFAVGFPVLVIGLVVLGWAVRHAFVELHRSRAVLAQEQLAVQKEAERARLAREMHDSLGKTLHGIHLASSAMRLAAGSGDSTAVDQLAGDIERASRVAADEGRSILRGLRREQLDRPLAELLGELARSRSRSTVTVRTDITGVADVAPEVRREMVEVADEALENVERHSGARNAWIRLRADGDHATLEIEDDGRGFDPAVLERREREGHFGMRGMRERVEQLGGEFTLVSTPDGTRIETRWPQRRMEEAR